MDGKNLFLYIDKLRQMCYNYFGTHLTVDGCSCKKEVTYHMVILGIILQIISIIVDVVSLILRNKKD